MTPLRRKLIKNNIFPMKARNKKEAIEKLNKDHSLLIIDLVIPQEIPTEKFSHYVGLDILRQLVDSKYSKPIIVYTIVRDADIENEIKSHGIPYYYKGDTLIAEIFGKIVEILGKVS